MKVTELLSDKHRLEAAIGELVDNFYDSTGFRIEEIRLAGEHPVLDTHTGYIVASTAVKVVINL